MGLLDWFKKPPEPTSPASDRKPSHHYVLAHLALRQFALHDPVAYLGILASDEAEPFLHALLEEIAHGIGTPAPFTVAELTVHRVRALDYPCAIVEFPEPRGVTEPWFVALTLLMDMHHRIPVAGEPVPARYFTLERGLAFEETPRTVMAEWDAASHRNYGDGPEPTLGAFISRIEDLLG